MLRKVDQCLVKNGSSSKQILLLLTVYLWYACLVFFFQILSSLRNVRNNFMSLTNAKKEK